ncbi:MAG TPA: hypothetical protein VF719_10480, partial [Abditibacteriaceae bacterium]
MSTRAWAVSFLFLAGALFQAPCPVAAQQMPPTPQGTIAKPSLEALRARVEAKEKRVRDGALPADPQNLALWRFKIEQTRLYLQELDEGRALYSWATQSKLVEALDRVDIIERTRGDAT